MTPDVLAKSGTEAAHQTALFAWANMARLYGYNAANDDRSYSAGFAKETYGTTDAVEDLEMLFAIPNGDLREKKIAARLKAQGVKAGYPDMALDAPRKGYHGLRIELKRPASLGKTKGTISEQQVTWANRLALRGYRVHVCVGWREAAAVLESYLTL